APLHWEGATAVPNRRKAHFGGRRPFAVCRRNAAALPDAMRGRIDELNQAEAPAARDLSGTKDLASISSFAARPRSSPAERKVAASARLFSRMPALRIAVCLPMKPASAITKATTWARKRLPTVLARPSWVRRASPQSRFDTVIAYSAGRIRAKVTRSNRPNRSFNASETGCRARSIMEDPRADAAKKPTNANAAKAPPK